MELAGILKKVGYDSVFVFSDRIEVQTIIDDLIKRDVTIEFISTKNKITIFSDTLKLFIKYKPVLVHAHFENFILLLTAFLSLIFRSRYFVSFHSTISRITYLDYLKKKGLIKFVLLKTYYRFLIAVSENVICVSDAVKSQFCAFSGSNSDKILCLFLGVDLQQSLKTKIQLRSYLSLPVDKVLVCNVSAIEPIKGLDILIKAVNILKSQYNLTNFKCCHFGGLREQTRGNLLYQEELFQQVIKLQLENEFIWLGRRNDINEILLAFDIYVQPSRFEGLPVAIMEACANSLPVVGTNVGGIPEIIHQGINGFLFCTESAEELAAFLNKLIYDEELRKIMGNESFRLADNNFNIKKQTKKLSERYLFTLK